MSRMSMPRALAAGSELAVRPKSDGDDNNPLNRGGGRLVRTARMNVDALSQLGVEPGSGTKLLAMVSDYLINRPLNAKTQKAMLAELDKQPVAISRLKWMATTIAGLPEYQMH